MNLSDFSLLKEDAESYVVGHPKGKSITVPKSGLSTKAQQLVAKLKREQHFDTGGEVADPGFISNDQPLEVASNIPVDVVNSAPAQTQVPAGPEAPGAPAQIVEPVAQAPGTPVEQSVPIPDVSGALAKEERALQAGAGAEGAAGAETAKAYDAYSAAQANMPTPQDIFQKHQAADQHLQQAFASSKIDPDRYLHNMSTGSKIAAGIGMLLGGASAGTIGGPNLAVQAIHQAIERDIEAQKNDQSKAMNLWKMNREHTQDETQANLATQNQMLNGVKAKAMAAASRAQGPQAMARIAPMISQIDQQMAQNNMIRGILDSSAQGGFSNADPSTLVPYLVKDPAQQKQVYEEIGRAQNVSNNSRKIMDAFSNASKDNTVLSTGAGFLRTPGSVMALHQLLLPNFKQIDGTVRQAAMDETFHNVTPAPGDSAAKISQKRQALQDWMHSETAAPTAKGNHIDLTRFRSTAADPRARFTPQQSQYYNWAIQNPNDPKAQIVLQKLGVR